MAIEYRITTNADDESLVSGFAYSVVPAGNNETPMTWKAALVEYLIDTREAGSTVSEAPSLPASVTQAQLDSGDILEWRFGVRVHTHVSSPEKETELKAFLVAEELNTITVLQNRLRFWGREGSAF